MKTLYSNTEVSVKSLDFHSKFKEWRPGQWDAIRRVVNSEKRFSVVSLPTGAGKSLFYMALDKIAKHRTAILTGTKGLQHQLLCDFPHLTEVRGMGNYRCPAHASLVGSCDTGPCREGRPCHYREIVSLDPEKARDEECPYFKALKDAKTKRPIVTNYAYWMAMRRYSTGLGSYSMLVCDEGHTAHDWIANCWRTRITRAVLARVATIAGIFEPSTDLPDAAYVAWATLAMPKMTLWSAAEGDADATPSSKKDAIARNIEQLSKMPLDGSWHFESTGYGIQFEPIDCSKLAEKTLFQKIKKVLIVSATATPKTAKMLGCKPSEVEFIDGDSPFDLKSRPITHSPSVRVYYNMPDSDTQLWMSRMDKFIADRPGRKGIIHAVSYQRAHYIAAASRHRKVMMTHKSGGDMVRQIERFKRALPGTILVSPSVVTGYDFPGDECRWQIMSKIPFPSMKDGAFKARTALDKELPMHQACVTIAQAYGRGVRSPDDWCEMYIPDDQIKWFWFKNQHLMPKYCFEALEMLSKPPVPINLEGGE